MKWLWLLIVPLLFGLALLIAGLRSGGTLAFLFWLELKLILLTVAVPVVFWEHYRNRLIRARSDPFCVHCGWTLVGLPDEGKCPECGRPYRMKVVTMFRADPRWVMSYWTFAGRPPFRIRQMRRLTCGWDFARWLRRFAYLRFVIIGIRLTRLAG